MRRFIAAFINIISAVIVVGALSILHMQYPGESATTIMNAPTFEKSPEFNEILQERVNSIFTLISLKNCFETNNELNYNLTIAESVDKSNGIKKWTIKNCLDESKDHGLFIDKDFNVDVLVNSNTKPFSKNVIYNFMFKTYPSDARTGASTEEDFLTEFMYTLAKYHKCNFMLGSENSNFGYKITYFDEFDNITNEYSNTKLSSKEILDSKNFIYVSSRENIISSNIDTVDSTILKNAKANNPLVDDAFTLYCYVDTRYPIDDEFKSLYIEYIKDKSNCAILFTTVVYSSIIFVISLLLTFVFILSTKKSVDESTRMFYHIHTEFYVVIYILLVVSLYFAAIKYLNSDKFIEYDMNPIKTYVYVLIIYVTTVLLLTIFAAKFANDTLMPVSLNAIKEHSEQGDSYLNPGVLFSVIFIPIILFIIISVYLIYLFTMLNDLRILIVGIVVLVSTIGFVMYLLALHNAFNKAIQVQVKSNEMRTSLIANVSHDIKTPLTSILNYTNLISEEISNPSKQMMKRLEDYSETIINKSHRLNDLINDLIFDSKVTSGNVELDMVKLDLNAFITQVIAEFSGKLNEIGIKTVYNNSSASNVFILADGSQLYRVFQNLFSNIYKYALEKSRVYIDLESVKSKIIVTIKNIQKEKIEVDPDTLKDRFVRGNKSRTTEGFGLGLSISENLVNSMNGKLEITSNRDLFITKLTFVAYEE
ncbi:MAG: HAMP domain-containing histidine kinase [Lachnospiraceae bacterium]|nr:HAMP domain-containing histidine kinase [Lachnospiraceae bacterium]